MGRSSRRGSGRDQRATGRVIARGWGGAEDEEAPHGTFHGSTAGTPSPGEDLTAGARSARGRTTGGRSAGAALSGGSTARGSSAGIPSAGIPSAETPSAPAAVDDRVSATAPLRRRRWWLLGGIAALLVLVLVLPQVLVGERSPETEARSFLQAILDADTDAVREHVVEPEDGVLDVALTDQVTLAAEERVDRFTIEETSVDGDSAQVTATLSLGRRTQETTLHLTRHREGVLRRPVWELEPVELPVMRVAVPVSAPAVMINGVEVPLPDEAKADQAFGLVEVHLVVLPGVYQLSAPEGGEAVTPTTVRSTIPPVLGPWLNSLIEIGYELTETGEEQFSTYLIDTALAECARSTQPRPENCPLSAPEEVTGEGTWQIITPPQLHVVGGAAGYYDAYGYGGLAEFTVTAEDGTTTVHRVPIEETAIGMMSRDGDFSGTWFGNQETVYY